VAKPGAWGRDFSRFLERYSHLSGIWLNGEDMPREGNAVSLHPTQKDALGLPVANVHVDEHPNDRALRAHFLRQARAVLEAAGAADVLEGGSLPASHPMGTCRMSRDPAGGVVDSWGRAHDVTNLYIADASLFPTSSAENPTLTIVALAMRQAAHLAERLAKREV